MCAVSMVYDHYGKDNPGFGQGFGQVVPSIAWPTGLPASLPWTADSFAELKKIIERLDALDKKLGLEHCEDPKKAAWMKKIEKRLKALEGKRD